jgi:hypothetical protein
MHMNVHASKMPGSTVRANPPLAAGELATPLALSFELKWGVL